jgi:hypothetical protein
LGTGLLGGAGIKDEDIGDIPNPVPALSPTLK